ARSAFSRPMSAVGLVCVVLLSVVVSVVVFSGRASGGGRVLRRVDVRERVVAFSFDDGPDPRWTPRVLQLLRHFHATATFFVTGLNARLHPGLIHQELGQGGEIADHTYTHPYLVRLTAAAVQAQIERTIAAIERDRAPRPRLFRPPYGLLDDTVERLA